MKPQFIFLISILLLSTSCTQQIDLDPQQIQDETSVSTIGFIPDLNLAWNCWDCPLWDSIYEDSIIIIPTDTLLQCCSYYDERDDHLYRCFTENDDCEECYTWCEEKGGGMFNWCPL